MSKTIDWSALDSVWQAAPAITAVWAFGSAQDGIVRPGGDIDVGVLLNTPLDFDAQLNLLGALQTALQFADVDLVILNVANVMLRFEAVSGRRLFCRDDAEMARFVSLTAREYEDEMAMWQHALRNYTPIHQKGS
ncbi:MAG: nucleotidyltransferase domain-containing protein [Anaerolineales bacterium]|nr:nucleotidyltransferase domain-containing protein [Anaerolineales bacterium]